MAFKLSVKAPAAGVRVSGRKATHVCQAVVQDAAMNRRAMLAAGMGLLASIPTMSAQATVCVLADSVESEVDCLRQELGKDAMDAASYATKSAEKTFNAANGVPVSVLDSEYKRATESLGAKMKTYATMDVNDYKVRVPLIKSLKTEGTEWVSKYARGGSARSDSARRMYIAVDSLVGHLSANGYAPMPSPKLKAMLKSIGEAEQFLAIGK